VGGGARRHLAFYRFSFRFRPQIPLFELQAEKKKPPTGAKKR
jgi:hypothetical protein